MKKNKFSKYFFLFFILVLNKYAVNAFEFQFIPYQGFTEEIKTAHFTIIFPRQFIETAKKVAQYAEDIHGNLSPELDWKPYSRTIIVLTDYTDFPNGMSLPFYRNTITLQLAPADLEMSLNNTLDPLYTLILHEYAHILHLDQIRGAAWFWRILYGKLYHPLTTTFSWYYEGVAVLEESHEAPGGRLNSSYINTIIRLAAKNHKLPSYDKLIYPVVYWPNNNAVYFYGAGFIEYIYQKYGKDKFVEFIKDLSNDFWPFVLLFVVKFKKIYGVSLNDLWNEWVKYEEDKANASDVETEYRQDKMTGLEGRILSLDHNDEYMIFSNYSYKNDMYIYKMDYEGRLKKLIYGYCGSVSLTNDRDYILFTSPVNYTGGFIFFDLYSYNLKTGIKRRLTTRARINYVSFSKKNGNGIFVSNTVSGIRLYKGNFKKGKINNIVELIPPDEITFIGEPSVNPEGTRAVFSARRKDGAFRLFVLDMEKNIIELLDEKIAGKNPEWVDDESINFTAPDGITDSLYSMNISNKFISKIAASYGFILNGFTEKDRIYYAGETTEGQEIFSTNIHKMTVEKESLKDKIEEERLEIKPYNKDDKPEIYTEAQYSYPGVWGFIPYMLGSSAYFLFKSGNSGIPFVIRIPYVGPMFMITNSTPTGRFYYYMSVGFDYIKLYPDNTLKLIFRLPFINLSYGWNNYLGGYRDYVNDHFVELKHDGAFPIVFENSLSLDYNFDIPDGGNIYYKISFNHNFQQYNFSQSKMTNEISFYENLTYYYIKNRLKSTRWDRGIYLSFDSIQYPRYILNNIPIYILRGLASGRVPFYNSFYFINIDCGIEFLGKNIFSANSSVLKLIDSIIGGGGTGSINNIEMKAFPVEFIQSSYGSGFVSLKTGIDTTIVKKSAYIHFMTLGFREFYMKNYFEFLYLYNSLNLDRQYKGILFDYVLELGLDLFAAYGNIDLGIVMGGSIGYRIMDNFPAWGVYIYFNSSL